jgi:hypothetical protein
MGAEGRSVRSSQLVLSQLIAPFTRATAALGLCCLTLGCSNSPPETAKAAAGTAGAAASGGAAAIGAAGSQSVAGGGQVIMVPVPEQAPPRSPPGSCGLEKPAFCEDFETPSPGERSGDLDESRWSFARWGHETRQHFVRIPASTEPLTLYPSVFCGKPFTGLLPGSDVAICDGVGVDGMTSRQLNEVYDDQTDFAINSNRVRQLFDFTDRTGTIVFDVDAKVNPCNLGHGWWVELWITAEPAPIPYHEAPGVLSYPKNGLAIMFQGLNSCPQGRWATEVNGTFVSKDFAVVHDVPGWELEHDSDQARCIKVADQKLNRFKILLSQARAEVWASDYDDALNLHRLATLPNLNLPFTRGYVHLQHSQYNARKDHCDNGAITGVQTYRWDNVGFDGPTYVTPRGYGVDDNTEPDIDGAGGHMYGWYLTDKKWVELSVKGVDLSDATNASLDYSFLGGAGRVVQYRLNGGPIHDYEVPQFLDGAGGPRGGTRAFSHDVPVSELVSGDNTIAFMMAAPQTEKEEMVGNVELTVQPSK